MLIYLHKERMHLCDAATLPCSALGDDRRQALAARRHEARLADGLTTVFVRQGHYAAASAGIVIDPAPDMTIDHIADLHTLGLRDFHPHLHRSPHETDPPTA